MSDERSEEQGASGKSAGAEAEAATPAKAAKTAKAPTPARPRGLPPVVMLAAVVLAALSLGGAAGSLLLGPRIAAMRAAPGSPEASEGEATEPSQGHKDKKTKKKEESKAIVYRLDNIIVNPAGSQGTRFLMASVAFELPDARLEARLRERDFQVRDAIIATLERQSLQMLMAPGARDSVKRQIGLAVLPLTGLKRPVAVYLPQFVIQ
jgi:flagellar FliL protein